ncbi:hypothetical protein B0I37DRAFT_132290 [Chaetomium sp. MPI-CAGE-AT-0009]|nr:hypothetical protein B0I37DRAFT_132290 [Chaetomium sp. MPI-CAGE-AT-0009]
MTSQGHSVDGKLPQYTYYNTAIFTTCQQPPPLGNAMPHPPARQLRHVPSPRMMPGPRSDPGTEPSSTPTHPRTRTGTTRPARPRHAQLGNPPEVSQFSMFPSDSLRCICMPLLSSQSIQCQYIPTEESPDRPNLCKCNQKTNRSINTEGVTQPHTDNHKCHTCCPTTATHTPTDIHQTTTQDQHITQDKPDNNPKTPTALNMVKCKLWLSSVCVCVCVCVGAGAVV